MSDEKRQILIWDLPLRLFHWGLVICLAGSWITAEAGFDWTQWHFYFGYASLTLLLFRIIWGFAGARYARFSSWPIQPRAVLQSLTELFKPTAHPQLGHNPLGSLAIILMLASVATQAITGLFISDDIFWAGPYNGAVSSDTAGRLANIHHLNFDLLVTLVSLHLLAMVFYRLYKKEHLVGAMITGHKLASETAQPASNQLLSGLMVLLISAAAIGCLIYFAPPPAPVSYF